MKMRALGNLMLQTKALGLPGAVRHIRAGAEFEVADKATAEKILELYGPGTVEIVTAAGPRTPGAREYPVPDKPKGKGKK